MSLISFPDYVYDTSKVPKAFQAFLPSSEVENLEPQRDKSYIISSFLKNASLDAWKWMLTTYTKEDIRQTLRQERNLTPKDAYIWVHYLPIPKEEVLCLQPQYQLRRSTTWRY